MLRAGRLATSLDLELECTRRFGLVEPQARRARTVARLPHWWPLLGACLVLLGTPAAARASTFTVLDTNDSGAGSLRDAITMANAHPGANTISFAMPGTITLASPLPPFTNAVSMTGPSMGITLNGAAAGASATGLDLEAGSSNSTVAGNITIDNFAGDGLVLNNSSFDVIKGLHIGTDSGGSSALPNGGGIFLSGTASNNTIGGTGAGAGDIISGNSGFGIDLSGVGVSGNVIQGDFIGVNGAGTAALGNGTYGVQITGAPSNTIGGTAAGAGDVISGNSGFGVLISGSGAANNTVEGNLIGTDASGSVALGNGGGGNGGGIFVSGAPNNAFGSFSGGDNVISGNTGAGITVDGSSATGDAFFENFVGTNSAGATGIGNTQAGVLLRNGATGNSFFANTIDFNNGPGVQADALDNFFGASPMWGNLSGGIAGAPGTPPTITGAAQSDPTHILITFFFAGPANSDAEVDVFLNPSNAGLPQGKTFLGNGTFHVGASGSGTFQETVPGVLGNNFVSMYVTPFSSGTSAFSPFFPPPVSQGGGGTLTFSGSPLLTPASGSLTATKLKQQRHAVALALLRQLHPDWSVEELKAVLLNANAPLAPGTLMVTPTAGNNATINPFTISGTGFPSGPFAPSVSIPFAGAPAATGPIPLILHLDFSGDATPGKFIYLNLHAVFNQSGFPTSSATGGFFFSSPAPYGESFHRPGSASVVSGAAARSKGKRLRFLEVIGKVLDPAPAGVVNELLPGVADPNAIAGVAMALVRIIGKPKGVIEGDPKMPLPAAPKGKHARPTGSCFNYQGGRSLTKAPEQGSICGGLNWIPVSYDPRTTSFTYLFSKHLPAGHYRAYFLAYTKLGLGNPAIDDVRGVHHAAYAQAALVCKALTSSC